MRRLASLLMVGALLAPVVIHADAKASTATVQADESLVRSVQRKLRSLGYSVPVDGNAAGRRTVRAVAHWQRANGIRVTGYPTEETLSTLRIQAAPSAGLEPAVRLNPPPPEKKGLYGLPLAPEGLSGCDEMNFYRLQWGLPERFSDQPRVPAVSFGRQGLGWRESNCRNEVISSTGCCGGYWQLYINMFARDHRMRSKLADCDVRVLADVVGTEPYDKQRNACVAKSLYEVQGIQAWAL